MKIPTGERRGHARKRYTEEVRGQLRTIELELGKGLAVVEACLGITEQIYYRWKKEYGGLRVDQAKWLKGLEQENARLKRLVADLSLGNVTPREFAEQAAQTGLQEPADFQVATV